MREKVRVCDVCETAEMFEEGLVNSAKKGQDLEEYWQLCTEEVSGELQKGISIEWSLVPG